jgi:hypothetical protein
MFILKYQKPCQEGFFQTLQQVASSSKNKFFCISKNNPNILPKWSLSSI